MYNNVNELALDVREKIDMYWRLEKSEEEFLSELKSIFELPKNCGLALRGAVFSTTFEQRLGKKRMAFLKTELTGIDSRKFHFN